MKIAWRRRFVNEFFHSAQQSATWRIDIPPALVLIGYVVIHPVPGVITAVRYGNAVRAEEGPVVLEVSVNPKAPFVHQRMVLRTQQHELVDRRLAAIGPVLDVVDVDKAFVAAPREAAGVLVPGANSPCDALGYDA